MFSLKGKTAIITGASGGIGQDIAKKLCLAGANLVISGTREEVLNELAKELSAMKVDDSQNIYVKTCNLSDTEEVKGFFDKVEEEIESPVDILVCNAGITRDNLAMRMKDEEWDSVININLTSIFHLNKAAIKSMMKRKYGRIINITSVVAFTGNFGQANYTAAKGGLVAMSKTFAKEVATRGITVNCIAPGFIRTAMTEKIPEKVVEKIMSVIPMAKMGDPMDIANGVLYLSSDEAGYVTGSTLHINGGMYTN